MRHHHLFIVRAHYPSAVDDREDYLALFGGWRVRPWLWPLLRGVGDRPGTDTIGHRAGSASTSIGHGTATFCHVTAASRLHAQWWFYQWLAEEALGATPPPHPTSALTLR